MSASEPPFRFSPLAKIASGGTATVYVGARRDDATLVALKRPHAHVLDDERQRAALLREARLAASFVHPNLVRVRLVEEAGANLQLVMDYVEGSALGALIALAAKNDARLPAGVAVRIVLDACRGLHAVHEHRDERGYSLGLVHRDVSPQNILVGTDGVARVTDFGLAKAVYEGAPSTTQGTLKGKLGYMAPEYVNRGRLDRGIDVFALGVVLWEALAGRRLFRGDNEVQTLDRILHATPSRLAEIAPELAPFDPLLSRALAKDPALRSPSAEALALELEAVAERANALATPEQVAAYVEQAVGAELTRRQGEVAKVRAHRRRPRARAIAWALSALAVVSVSTLLLVRAVREPGHASATPAPPASTSATVSASAGEVERSFSAPVPAAPADSVSIELDPAPRPTASPARPRMASPRQPPPNPYIHRDAAR